jgi:hypothetical protein
MCCCDCGGCRKPAEVKVTVDAPNYIGSPSDLVRALTKAEQSGQLDALKRRFK